MCLIIFAHQMDPRYPLVVAANRDELFSRASAQASLWADDETGERILSGRDLLAGGTWLGVTQSGRFAAVTNIRDPSQTLARPRSRGDLTRQFLAGGDTAEEYCARLAESYDQFAGYNLLVGDGRSLYYVNNFQQEALRLKPGLYGLSNGALNTSWPKVEKGRTQLQSLMQGRDAITLDHLLAIMGDRVQAEDAALPDTGIGIETERKLSSAFILNPERDYGTLCSTALIIEQSGGTRLCEQNFDSLGNKTQGHYFQLPPN